MAPTAPDDRAAQAQLLAEVLQRPEIRAFARNRLTSYGLHGTIYGVDDLLMGVAERVLRRLATCGPIDDGAPDPLERYVTRAIANAVIDLHRARPRAGRPDPLDDVLGPDGDRVDDPALITSAADPFDGADWDAVRHVVHARVSVERPWVTAGVLAHLAIDECPDRPLPDRLRRPQNGTDVQVANWVALQYAGRHRCFETPESPTVAKRRSKAIASLLAALRQAVAVAWDLPAWVTSGSADREEKR